MPVPSVRREGSSRRATSAVKNIQSQLCSAATASKKGPLSSGKAKSLPFTTARGNPMKSRLFAKAPVASIEFPCRRSAAEPRRSRSSYRSHSYIRASDKQFVHRYLADVDPIGKRVREGLFFVGAPSANLRLDSHDRFFAGCS